MKLILYPTLFVSLLFVQHKAQGQERCATVAYENLLKQKEPSRENTEQFEKWLSTKLYQQKRNQLPNAQATTTYTLPVVVHVLYYSEEQNISNAQIQSQLEVLNNDFQRLNTDAPKTPAEFLPVAGNLDINFVLAKQDPEGLPTTGINRIKVTQTGFQGVNSNLIDDIKIKAYSYWPAEDYLNIWVVNFNDGTLGYAQFPVSSSLNGIPNDVPSSRLTDGLVIQYNAFGSTDAGNFNLKPAFNKGRTVTHEMGHFLGGLRHIWGDASDCSGTDYVNDTPNQQSATSGCPTTKRTSCGVNNMYQNYMDYTNDACMNLFSQGQVDRMKIVLANSPRRKKLVNLARAITPTSVTTDLKLISIDSPSPIFCATSTAPVISVKNIGPNAITSFKVAVVVNSASTSQQLTGFSLQSGEQQQFTLQPQQFAEGVGTLTLTVSEPNGLADPTPSNNTLTKNFTVSSSTEIIPYRQDFNNPSYNDWAIISQGQAKTWVSSPTHKGLSLRYNGFTNATVGDQSWLASPTLNLSNNTNASVFFDVSYANRNNRGDNLTVLASTNCGLTFTTNVFDKAGTELSSATSTNEWVPQADTDWTREYINLTPFAGMENVRLAFVATNDNGNALYLDNVEFFIDDNPYPVTAQPPYAIYSSRYSDFNITFNLAERQDVRLVIYNTVGQVITDQQLPAMLNQTYPGEIPLQAPGLYIVRVQIGQQVYATKVWVSH